MNQTTKSSWHVLSTLLILCTAAAAPPAMAADWGSLKGRFVVEGTAPTPAPLVVDKDQYCIDNKPTSDTVIVGKDNALVNAVAFLFLGRGAKVEVHPDYVELLKEPAVIDNKGCRFVPHLVTVTTGQPFVIKNSDPLGHNTNVLGLFNETIAAGEERTRKFDKATRLPVPVSCGIHPFMKGHLLIQEHPYMAVSGEDGSFEIKNIPVGKHDFMLWHETGYLKDLKLSSGKTDRRGLVKLAIESGKPTDLGVIKVPASLLK
jgi:hypothetical protein